MQTNYEQHLHVFTSTKTLIVSVASSSAKHVGHKLQVLKSGFFMCKELVIL